MQVKSECGVSRDASWPRGPEMSPIRTLYVNNLNPKLKVKELKWKLKDLFRSCGEVTDIVAMSSFWRRGQVYIVMSDLATSKLAFEKLHGTLFEGRKLRVNYALEESSVVQKALGVWKPKKEQREGGLPMRPRAVREREEKFLQAEDEVLDTTEAPNASFEAAARVQKGASGFFYQQLALKKEEQGTVLILPPEVQEEE